MGKVENARKEYLEWCRSLGVGTIGELNAMLEAGKGVDLINLCEANQERKYAAVADRIHFLRKKVRIVMMSGPSSSGKTSSSLRIAQQARVIGLTPKVIELDNYFIDRDKTPKDADGKYDFECLEAMDLELLSSNLRDLLDGKDVLIPRFDFPSGKSIRNEASRRLRLSDGDVLFMEGIHALNPKLLEGIDAERVMKIYISSLSAYSGAEENHYSTADKRLLRRIVRDSRTRGIDAESTIIQWPSVRDGEIKHIFPFEENADIVFNSGTVYDVPLLKYYADPLVLGISESSPAHGKAVSLLAYTSLFKALTPKEIASIPPTSIMREFIGGQTL